MTVPRLSPFDVVLALRLTSAAGTFAAIAEDLHVAPSQVHAALRRLEIAGLLKPDSRDTNARALAEFLLFGVRYAFPAARGPLVDGIPTAYLAPPLSTEIDALDVLVWPHRNAPGAVRGFSIPPLYRQAPALVTSSPATYQLLTLVDAMRLGDPRSRNAARSHLEKALGWRSA